MATNQHDPAEQKFQAIEAEIDAPTNPEIMPGIRPIWYSELAKMDLPPPSWVVDKLIPDEGVTVLSAAPASFKTWLVFDIAIQVAQGNALFGQFETNQTKVLIVDEESGLRRLRDRLQKLGITEDVPLATISKTFFKLTDNSAKLLAKSCKDAGIGLVVFDSLTRIHTSKENDAQEMATVMENLRRLAQAGIAVLLIHHDRKQGQGFRGKGGASEMRGSVEINAACDVQISIMRESGTNRIVVSQNKNRDAEEISFKLEVRNDDDRTWFEYRGDKPSKRKLTEAEIIQLLTPGKRMYQGEIVAALKDSGGISEKTTREILSEMTEQHKLELSKGDKNKSYYCLPKEQSGD